MLSSANSFQRNITIRDVAARAGVAVSTVSRVLSRGYASDEARQRVTLAVQELGYHPNQMARGLIRRESRTVGLILPDITNPFFPALTRGVEDKARESGYSVLLANTDNRQELENAAIQTLLERRVDGLIVTTAGTDGSLFAGLIASGFPLVVMDRHLAPLRVNSVGIDNVAGGRRAVEHLLGLGHRRIAYIGGVPGIGTDRERMNGYRTALTAAGMRVDEQLIRHGHFRFELGYEVMGELLTLDPTAVFAANDLMALGAVKAIRESGLSVPHDISVVGFDDIAMAEMMFPSLTTVRQPAYQLGSKAAEMLLSSCSEYPPGAVQEVVFQPELIQRDSSAAMMVARR